MRTVVTGQATGTSSRACKGRGDTTVVYLGCMQPYTTRSPARTSEEQGEAAKADRSTETCLDRMFLPASS